MWLTSSHYKVCYRLILYFKTFQTYLMFFWWHYRFFPYFNMFLIGLNALQILQWHTKHLRCTYVHLFDETAYNYITKREFHPFFAVTVFVFKRFIGIYSNRNSKDIFWNLYKPNNNICWVTVSLSTAIKITISSYLECTVLSIQMIKKWLQLMSYREVKDTENVTP